MEFSHILFSVEKGTGIITLNRPDVLNSFNKAMGREVQQALDQCATNPDIRCIMITGAGRAFCAGQDLAEAVSPGVEISSIVRETYNPIIERIRNIEKPVVAKVNGVAAGAGANIALACDITVAGESANFIQSFSKIGLIPDSAGTFFLPRLVGMQRAAALTMLGEKISASRAEEWGMIWKSVPDDQLNAFADELCAKLAGMPTRALGLTKKAMNLGQASTLKEQLSTEDKLQSEAGSTHDYREGVNAFLEKRKPVYTGT